MRTMKALVLSLLLVASATANAATSRRVHQLIDLSTTGHLSVNTHNGSIAITTWNQPRVQIDARIEPGDSDHPEDIDKVEVQISGSGSDVRVETNYDAIPYYRSWFSQTRSLPPVHYTISMPATASLDIDDHNAAIRVSSLNGQLRISGHNGTIDVRDHSGAALINVHNAEVRVAFRQVNAPSEIETHNGSIDLQLPQDARFNINANGNHLDVESDFPVVTKRFSRDAYVGDVNGGGPELRISTHNGSLRLKRM